MSKDKLTEQGLLQIRGIDPEIIRKFKIYAVSNGITHAETFTKAVQILITGNEALAEIVEKEAAKLKLPK